MENVFGSTQLVNSYLFTAFSALRFCSFLFSVWVNLIIKYKPLPKPVAKTMSVLTVTSVTGHAVPVKPLNLQNMWTALPKDSLSKGTEFWGMSSPHFSIKGT